MVILSMSTNLILGHHFAIDSNGCVVSVSTAALVYETRRNHKRNTFTNEGQEKFDATHDLYYILSIRTTKTPKI